MTVVLASLDTIATTDVTDFSCMRVGAELLLQGRDPYDAATWESATRGVFADRYGVVRAMPCLPGASRYPLWTTIALVPLAALGKVPAAALWQCLLVGGTVAGTILAWIAVGGERRGWPTIVAIVLSSALFWHTLLLAQFGGVLTLLVGAIAYAARERRETLTGIAVAALALKPHIAFLVPPVALLLALRRGARRPLIVAAVALAAAAAVSVALRPEWPGEWLAGVFGYRVEGTTTYPTVWSLAARAFGDARFGAVIILVSLAVVAALLRGVRIDDVSALALAVTASLVVVPYIGLHDELTLALPWAKVLAVALAVRGTWGSLLAAGLLFAAALLPWGLEAFEHLILGDESPGGVVPLASMLLLAVAVRADPRARAV